LAVRFGDGRGGLFSGQSSLSGKIIFRKKNRFRARFSLLIMKYGVIFRALKSCRLSCFARDSAGEPKFFFSSGRKKTGRSVRDNAGNFFFPSPAANLVSYGEGGHEKVLPFRCDFVNFAPFIFQQNHNSLSSQREKVPQPETAAELFYWFRISDYKCSEFTL
jgi:hypothetical protein